MAVYLCYITMVRNALYFKLQGTISMCVTLAHTIMAASTAAISIKTGLNFFKKSSLFGPKIDIIFLNYVKLLFRSLSIFS